MKGEKAVPALRLSRWMKSVYALGELMPSVGVGTVIPFYFLIFLTDIAGIRPGIAGSVLFVVTIWDAINDPLVGALSDRSHHRLGRRRPFILAGMLPMALFYALLWIVPPIRNAHALAFYYLGVYFLFDLSYTLVSGPYAALMPELSLDPDERTSIVTYRMAVSIIVGLVTVAVLPFVFAAAGSMRQGLVWAGAGVAVLCVIPFILIVLLFRERPEFQSRRSTSLRESFVVVLRNRAFWLSLAMGWLAWLAIRIVEAVFAYYVIYWTRIPEEDSAYVLAAILASATLFLPLVNWLSNRFEKKWAFVICTLSWTVLHSVLWFVPAGEPVPVYVIAVLAGLGISSAHVLPTAMGADVLESIEAESGLRQEGIFGGASSFIQKLGTSVAVLAIGWVLDLTGYVANASVQSPSALTGIRAMVSWVPAALLVVSIASAAFFPITRAVHRHLSREAELKRAAAQP